MQIIQEKKIRKLLNFLPAIGLVLPGVLFANDYPIVVNFEGEYIEETCEVKINGNSSSETVTLPVLSTTALSDSGGEGGNTDFNITLQGCPASRDISLIFNSSMSDADATTGNLINQAGDGYSKNIQVRLRKEDGNQMIIDDLTTAQQYSIPAAGSPVTHQYSVSYFSAGTVTAGIVRSMASITLDYQ